MHTTWRLTFGTLLAIRFHLTATAVVLSTWEFGTPWPTTLSAGSSTASNAVISENPPSSRADFVRTRRSWGRRLPEEVLSNSVHLLGRSPSICLIRQVRHIHGVKISTIICCVVVKFLTTMFSEDESQNAILKYRRRYQYREVGIGREAGSRSRGLAEEVW